MQIDSDSCSWLDNELRGWIRTQAANRTPRPLFVPADLAVFGAVAVKRIAQDEFFLEVPFQAAAEMLGIALGLSINYNIEIGTTARECLKSFVRTLSTRKAAHGN